MGVALWITPRKRTPLYDALHSVIDGLKPLFEDGHRFEPHVTLTSGIHVSNQAQAESVLDQAAAASKCVPEITVQLAELKYGTQFFKKVYFHVAPNAELISLARVCREQFVTKPKVEGEQKHFDALSESERQSMAEKSFREAHDWAQNEFDPHLSLVYSMTYPVDEAVKRTIDTRLQDVFGSDYETRGIGWTNGRIQLVRCEGRVEDWEVLGYRDI